MLKLLKEKGRLNETLFLLGISIVSFFISLIRYHYYQDLKSFHLLNWNLFLAFIPWLLTSIVTIKPEIQKNKILDALLLAVWLLFFPNSLYILTDFFHLAEKSPLPLGYHVVLILSYSWTGLLFGIFSLWDIEKILSAKLSSRVIKIISVFLLFLASFGIYLGRYLRWNSWDIITEPFKLMYGIKERVFEPFSHLRTWEMTLLMWVVLNIIYWSFVMVKKRQ